MPAQPAWAHQAPLHTRRGGREGPAPLGSWGPGLPSSAFPGSPCSTASEPFLEERWGWGRKGGESGGEEGEEWMSEEGRRSILCLIVLATEGSGKQH